MSVDLLASKPPRKFPAKVHSKNVCINRHKEDGKHSAAISLTLPNSFNDPSIICAGNDEEQSGTCPGDSGEYFNFLFEFFSRTCLTETLQRKSIKRCDF